MKRGSGQGREVRLSHTATARESYKRRHFANADYGDEDGGFDVLPTPPERRSEQERANEAEALVGGDWDGLNVREGFSSSSKMHSKHVTGRGLHNKIGQDDKRAVTYGDDTPVDGFGNYDDGLTPVEDRPNVTGSRKSAPNLGPKPRREAPTSGLYSDGSRRR
jgi:hypothetical protein